MVGELQHGATVVMFAQLNPCPIRIELEHPRPTRWLDPRHDQTLRGQINGLVTTTRAVIQFERDVNDRDIETTESDHWPCAEQPEPDADDEVDRAQNTHQHDKAARRQRAMRSQHGAKRLVGRDGIAIRVVCFPHLDELNRSREQIEVTMPPAIKSKKPQPKILAGAGKPKLLGKPGTRKAPLPAGLSADVIAEIFRRFHAREPEPKGELEHLNPYTLLVAVVLSAQATDAGVNKATRALFKVADTPEKMVALGEDTVRDYLKTIGLYRNKAKNVIALSQALIVGHGSIVPADRDALVKLPGVGRKTANVVLNMAFGQLTMAVDTHVFRVGNRTGMAPGKDVEAVEDVLMEVVPQQYGLHAHHWLILHGRYTCLARKPMCFNCIIADLCLFEPKTVV